MPRYPTTEFANGIRSGLDRRHWQVTKRLLRLPVTTRIRTSHGGASL